MLTRLTDEEWTVVVTRSPAVLASLPQGAAGAGMPTGAAGHRWRWRNPGKRLAAIARRSCRPIPSVPALS